ncbi:MAG TPA: hypothetical protein VGB10_07140, partial [Bacteroidota bacterium]
MKIESFLRWLAIVLFTALAIFVTVPAIAMTRDAILRHATLYSATVGTMVISWIVVVRFLFQDFYVRGQLYGGVKRFYQRVLEHPLRGLYALLMRRSRNLNLRFTFIGVGILFMVYLLSITHMLSDRALIPFQIPLVKMMDQPGQVSTVPTMTHIALTTPDNNSKHYLEACFKIAQDLKEAGARVMVMEIPQNIPLVDEYLSLVSELNKTGIIVFATRSYDLPKPFTRLRYTQHPILQKMDIPWAHYTYEVEDLSLFHNVDRFVPYRYIDISSGNRVPDIAVEVLRKYSGATTIETDGNVVTVGDYRLPISENGSLYSYHGAGYKSPTTAAWLRLTTDTGDFADLPKAEYMVFTGNPRTSSFSSHTTPSLKGFEELFKDKIVNIAWDNTIANIAFYDGLQINAYSTLLDNILTGKNLVRKAESGQLYLTLLSVLLCGLFARYFRGLYAVPLMLLVGVGLFFGATWLVQNQQILLDILYP